MRSAGITALAYHLPDKRLTNENLATLFPDWEAEKILEKTGITSRPIAAENECASDLAVLAAEKLFSSNTVDRRAIDFVLFCTQSPDHFLPTTACLIQQRLKLATSCGALDFNLGCSGFVSGLGLAKGLIETGQASRILLLTAETYSKYMHSDDRSTRALFGDAGAAVLVEATESPTPLIGPFVYGTDGTGGTALQVFCGGARMPAYKPGNDPGQTAHLHMNGPDVFNFTLNVVPKAVNELLQRAELKVADVDLYVFHQANKFMLDHLRRKSAIPEDKFWINMSELGNTVSCTIPIALQQAASSGRVHKGSQVMLVGFGVGLSWSLCLVRWGAVCAG